MEYWVSLARFCSQMSNYDKILSVSLLEGAYKMGFEPKYRTQA